MVTDHGKANHELKALSEAKAITLPMELDAKQKETRDKLSALSGAAFDKAYMDEMKKDHDKDVSEFQKQAKNGNDPQLKEWAAKTLPTLQAHKQLADRVHVEDRVEVRVDDRIPIVLGHLLERVIPSDAGIVDQNVNRAGLLSHLCHASRAGVVVRYVDRYRANRIATRSHGTCLECEVESRSQP